MRDNTVPLEDPLVVCGRGIYRKKYHAELTRASQLNAIAAGLIFTRESFAKNLLLVGGHTAGVDLPSEAFGMSEFMYRYEPDIPRENVYLEQYSIDTPDNIIQCMGQGYIHKGQDQLVSVLTSSQHMERTQELFLNIASIKVVPYCMQDIIHEHGSREQKRLLTQYEWTLGYGWELIKETILRQIVKYDPLGERMKTITTRLRHA